MAAVITSSSLQAAYGNLNVSPLSKNWASTNKKAAGVPLEFLHASSKQLAQQKNRDIRKSQFRALASHVFRISGSIVLFSLGNSTANRLSTRKVAGLNITLAWTRSRRIGFLRAGVTLISDCGSLDQSRSVPIPGSGYADF